MENVCCSTPTEKSPKTQNISKKSPQKTKFRPFQIPRYLPGQVRKTKLMQDLKDYNKHRYQVFTAAPRIDARPPLMNPNKYNNAQRLISNRYRVDEIQRQNKDIIKKINTINIKGGWVDSFNPHAYDFKSNWRSHQLKMREIVEKNEIFYDRITKAKSDYAFKDSEKFWNHVVAELKYYTRFPLIILDKIPLDTRVRQQPSISDGEFVDRPKCFMDFRVKDGVYLGRIVIELYHDYVPVTVQNFMSICCDQDGLSYKNCQVHRVFPGLYIEAGDITKGNGKGGASIYGETFVEENHMLKHSRMGVLSMVPVRPKLNNSQFSITLTAMEKFDESRVVFGKVIKGNTTLCKISDLGRKFGMPVVSILINNCGKFIKGQTPSVVKKFKYH